MNSDLNILRDKIILDIIKQTQDFLVVFKITYPNWMDKIYSTTLNLEAALEKLRLVIESEDAYLFVTCKTCNKKLSARIMTRVDDPEELKKFNVDPNSLIGDCPDKLLVYYCSDCHSFESKTLPNTEFLSKLFAEWKKEYETVSKKMKQQMKRDGVIGNGS